MALQWMRLSQRHEERYAVSVQKDTLAKLIVVSEINNVELEGLINCILEKGIEEYGFYE